MKFYLQKISLYFQEGYRFARASVLFKKALYTFLLFKAIYWLAYYPMLFGAENIIYTKTFDIGPLKNPAFLLYGMSGEWASLFFILAAVLISLLHLCNIRIYFLSDVILWFIVLNIHNKIYSTLTGGEYLLNQLLFFNCFISAKLFPAVSKIQQSKIVLHNLGVTAVLIQICIVYFISGLAKLRDPAWLTGDAIYNISQIEHFSLPLLATSAPSVHWLLIGVNYLVLFYQLAFPLLIWVSRIKKPFLVVGILMHLYIAFVMGLVSFGLLMLLCYIYFWPLRKQS